MSENDRSLDPNRDQLIPSFVGQYRRKAEEKIPQIVIIDSESNQTKAEKSLCNFFKCTKNWNQNEDNDHSIGGKEQKCFATRNTDLIFENHLKEKHANDLLFCVYCYHMRSNKTVLKNYSHRYLIKHMFKRHRFRRFQCNQCLYRAVTEDHMSVHQKLRHESLYLKAINGSNEENVCKIFLCQAMKSEIRKPNLQYFYRKYRIERFNSEGKNETLFQCLYCDFMSELLPKVIEHCVERHPDFPLLYYIPEPQISSSTNNELINDFITFDNICIVRPKLEPQDNCVSSTHENCENNSVIRLGIESNGKRLDPESSGNSGGKRLKVDTNIPINIICMSSSGSKCVSNNFNQILSINDKREQKKIICLFCDQIFIDYEIAKPHIESHFRDLEVSDNMKKLIHTWIQHFLVKQWHLSSFEDKDKRRKSKAYYYCPLCVKLAKINNRFVKRYKTYSEVRDHVWQHCCWLSVKCKICLRFLPNCDQIIAKHLNVEHFLLIKSRKLRFLSSNESDLCFTSEQRLELEKRFIEVNENHLIESLINRLLAKVKHDFEKQLRVINNCDKSSLTTCVTRLPNNEFVKYFNEFVEYEEKKEIKMVCDIIDKRCEEYNKSTKESKKSKKEKSGEYSGHKSSKSHKSTKNKERIDKSTKAIEPNEQQMSIILSGESTGISPMNSNANNIPNSVPSADIVEIDGNIDSIDSDEYYRISCYNCNDKFKTKKEWKEHHNKQHRGQAMRGYAKHRKLSNI